jgi:TPR repeat protein
MANGDYAQARRHLEQAVQGGDAGAACHLGEMTLKGQGGITANQDAAAKLFQLAQSRNTICFAPGQ